MKASAWAKREFENGSIPDNRTIKKWVESGILRGRVVDSSVWIISTERWGIESVISSCVDELIKAS
ncbi:hypothetical protein [Moellerella wisconsensis]|uniref:Uncharacterized protein n=1 Tax=Moellerella wisconsensis TaxID=158849 RepID=A0ACD3Y522_9GAMM|nr:hypothetical protein [Moellerella wisconsensis]UNH37824.1 hypothetical protein MNY70_09865 [Moellerella wisconsensis]